MPQRWRIMHLFLGQWQRLCSLFLRIGIAGPAGRKTRTERALVVYAVASGRRRHLGMISLLAILTIGFFLGMRHATDPDHVIAVSTIVSRERSLAKAALIGALWGLGHTITIVLVGAAIILFNVVIPPRVGLTMEFAVGLMLILLGVLNLAGVTKWMSEKFSPSHPTVTGEHAHIHGHGSALHFHWHQHQPAKEHHAESLSAPGWLRAPFAKLGVFHSMRPLFIGIVHGLAGSAAVALLVLSTIHQPRWGVLYL